jgi:S-adenosylmethionine hydrolase
MITLTTDFGTTDSYVAQMKGIILGINPQVEIVDVTHTVPPQDIARGGVIIDEIARVFPAGTIHVAVVDPGVGSQRGIIGVEAAAQRFLAPDNGLLGAVLAQAAPERIHCVTREQFWRVPVSATFHARDIFAPVAAHWSLGVDLAEFGPAIDAAALVRLAAVEPRQLGAALVGRVEAVDSFGNLITNINQSQLAAERGSLCVLIAGRRIAGVSRCYSDCPPGTLLALIGSSGRLEIAVNSGSAAKLLSAGAGTEVRVE